MNNNKLMAALTIALSTTVSVGVASQVVPKVIYGEDDRLEVYEVTDASVRELADSTVALIENDNLEAVGNGYKIKSVTFGEGMNLCKDEPFRDQPFAANCSGSLIGEDLVMTAGHCIEKTTCGDYKFVFNYKMNSPTFPNTQLDSQDVYSCKSILVRELTSNQDYAVVKLDRPVRGHKPLTLAKDNAKVGDSIFVIGHPSGIPTKIASGASVRSTKPSYFVANLDTYGGNSGSAVFSTKTNEVVGILVRGARDFNYDSTEKCNRSNKCADDACRGEDVTNISYVNKFLNQ